ncbi:MAG: metallophosphoesterase [Sedimentisphaerales bacterium]|nr:metallophosphoesterase [Sedimentisphaerales bacterium]
MLDGAKFLPFALSLVIVGASASAGADRWRFITTCDSRGGSVTGVNEPILGELVEEILRHDVDFVMFPGDLVYGARVGAERFEEQLWHWVAVLEPVYEAGVTVYVCRGNHEVGDMWDAWEGELPNPLDNYALRWLNVFGSDAHPDLRLPGNGPAGERYMTYSATRNNALVVALDQYAGMRHQLAHQLNQVWLDAQLRQNTQPHVFVFGHEPAFRTLHFDCLDWYPAQRDAFWDSLQAAGARTYFCGHDHFYDHGRIDDRDGNLDNDIHQFIVGTAGAYPYFWVPPYDGDNGEFTVEQVHHAERFGYVLVEIDDLDVTVTWMQRQDNDVDVPGVYEAGEVWSYAVSPALTVTHPNGGERFVAGRPLVVEWKTVGAGDIERVLIEYSLDGGASWLPAGEAENTGLHAWLAPEAKSSECLVRVRAGGSAMLSDVSDAAFSIYECPVKLAADLNGDCTVDFADLAVLAAEWLAGGVEE